MGGTTITLTGADEAHYQEMSRRQTRLIEFPDGLTRSLTLQNRFWRIYDLQIEENPTWVGLFAGAAFEHAQIRCSLIKPPEELMLREPADDPEKFENVLRECFRAQLTARLTLRSERENTVSNSNK